GQPPLQVGLVVEVLREAVQTEVSPGPFPRVAPLAVLRQDAWDRGVRRFGLWLGRPRGRPHRVQACESQTEDEQGDAEPLAAGSPARRARAVSTRQRLSCGHAPVLPMTLLSSIYHDCRATCPGMLDHREATIREVRQDVMSPYKLSSERSDRKFNSGNCSGLQLPWCFHGVAHLAKPLYQPVLEAVLVCRAIVVGPFFVIGPRSRQQRMHPPQDPVARCG